jgi:hypothetical protein
MAHRAASCSPLLRALDEAKQSIVEPIQKPQKSEHFERVPVLYRSAATAHR